MESWTSGLGLQRSVANARIALVPQYSLSFAMERNKPYFGRRLSAFQSPPVRYAVMAALTRHALRGKGAGRVLEIGSWAGASAITFGTVIHELGMSDGEIVCVDPWEEYFVDEDSSLHYRSMNAATVTGEIQNLFHHNVKACGLERMIHVRKAYSREALPEMENHSFDLVYIDGSHKKDEVLYDLQQAKRLVKSGGLICGDDLELLKSEIDPNAHQVALEKDLDFVADPRSGIKYHPGVTEAIAAIFNDVWQKYGFWCVERSGEQWSAPAFQAGHLEIPMHLQHAVEIPYGVFNGYECFQLGDGFVAYPIDDTHWFQNRIVESSIEELVLLLDAIQRIDKQSAPRIIESRHGFNIVSYSGKSWVLDQSVGEVDFRDEEQLRRLAASGQLLEAGTMGEAKAVVDNKFMEDLVARMESDQASLAQRLALITPEPGSEPRVLEEYQGYNLVAHEGRVWAVAMAAGPVDLTDSKAVDALVAEGRLLRAATVDGARATVDRTRNEARLAELEALVAQRKAERRTTTQEIERVRQEAALANERVLGAIRALEGNHTGLEAQLLAERRAATQEIGRVRQEAATANERALAVIRVLEEKQAGLKQRVGEQEEQLCALQANWAVRFARRVVRLLRETK